MAANIFGKTRNIPIEIPNRRTNSSDNKKVNKIEYALIGIFVKYLFTVFITQF